MYLHLNAGCIVGVKFQDTTLATSSVSIRVCFMIESGRHYLSVDKVRLHPNEMQGKKGKRREEKRREEKRREEKVRRRREDMERREGDTFLLDCSSSLSELPFLY